MEEPTSPTEPRSVAEPTAPQVAGKRLDPLVLLRECTMAKRKVRIQDEFLDFGAHRVHRSAKCGFRLSPSEPCIDVGSIWYMLKQIGGEKPYTSEFARKRGFKYIGIAVRSDLCDYLEGKTDTCRGLVQEVIDGRKRPRDDNADVAPALRRRTSAPKVQAKEGAGDGAAGAAPLSAQDFKAQDLCYADVEARVVPVRALDVLVRCPGKQIPNVDMILKIAQDEVSNWHSRRRFDAPREKGARAKQPLVRELEEYLAADDEAFPIILVPCNKSAPVNLLNVAAFLQAGRYELPDGEHTKYFESTRVDHVHVARNIDGRMWTFEIRDSAKNFTKAQWLRVVAVVTDASEWQFAGWPFETVVDLFTTCKGIYFREVGVLTPLHVRSWAVSILDLHQLQFQHRFAELRDAFWVEVACWLKTYRLRKFSNTHTLDKVEISIDKPLPVL